MKVLRDAKVKLESNSEKISGEEINQEKEKEIQTLLSKAEEMKQESEELYVQIEQIYESN